MIDDIERIPTQAEILSQIAAKRAAEEALEKYNKLMQGVTAKQIDAEGLQAAHSASQEAALKVFDSIGYSHSKSTKEHREVLCNKLSSWRSVCTVDSSKHCDTLSRLSGGIFAQIWESSFESSKIHCQHEWGKLSGGQSEACACE